MAFDDSGGGRPNNAMLLWIAAVPLVASWILLTLRADANLEFADKATIAVGLLTLALGLVVVLYGKHYRDARGAVGLAKRETARMDRLLSTVVDNAPDVVTLKRAADLRYVLVNRAAEDFMGKSSAEVVGRTYSEVAKDSRGSLFTEADREVIDTHSVVLLDRVRVQGGDGSERLLQIRKVPITGEAGDVQYILSITTDITEIIRAKDVLREHNANLLALIEERTHDLKLAQEEVLVRLERVLAVRDDLTGQHVGRMGKLCTQIAEHLGLSPQDCHLIGRAAPMHDIGKIGIPETILFKPGKLTMDEWEIMKTHSQIGADLLTGGASPLIQMAEQIALTHHERWDGTGYPSGLQGEDIPLVGRIVAVADVFDALISARPYKEAWPLDLALAEIESQSGRHFDPAVVEAIGALSPISLRDFMPKNAVVQVSDHQRAPKA